MSKNWCTIELQSDITTENTLIDKRIIYECLGLGHIYVYSYLELIKSYSL